GYSYPINFPGGDPLKLTKLSSICLITGSCLMLLAFQNCSKVGFAQDTSSAAFKSTDPGRNAGDDGLLGGANRVPGDDGLGGANRVPGDDGGTGVGGPELVGDDPSLGLDEQDDADWLYIPGGRGHVPMSSVAVCPAGSKDAGSQKCPFFCYKGVDYVMHKSEARNYFAKHFDRLPDYGGGAVPGTCANPDLKTKK